MLEVTFRTGDNLQISAKHYRCGHKKAVVLAHGFFNNKDVYLFREIARELSAHYDVLAFDFRGHGKSSGLFSWTSEEREDLKTAIEYLKQYEYFSIGVIGFSLGAAVCLIEAAHNAEIRTVIAVSAPYDFWKIDYHFWKRGMLEDLKLNLGFKGVGKGVRPGNPWRAKVTPLSVVGAISPRPVLFIHGSDDWLINRRHSEVLFEKAQAPKKLEIIQGGGHAEKLFDDHPGVFMETCLNWLGDSL